MQVNANSSMSVVPNVHLPLRSIRFPGDVGRPIPGDIDEFCFMGGDPVGKSTFLEFPVPQLRNQERLAGSSCPNPSARRRCRGAITVDIHAPCVSSSESGGQLPTGVEAAGGPARREPRRYPHRPRSGREQLGSPRGCSGPRFNTWD